MISQVQPAHSGRSLLTRLFTAVMLCAAMIFVSSTQSSAQVVKRAVQGGLLGAGIGAIAGGGKGAGKGAAIGAAVGAVAGAAERSNRREEQRHYRRSPPRQYSYAPPPPPPAYNDPLVYNIQSSLTRLGYDPGPVDGVYGQRTAEAIRAYEYNNQLPLTGTPSPNLYNHMVSHGG